MTVKTIAIIGTGIMGMGIAQIAAQAGITVLLFDAKVGAAEQGRQSLQVMLEKLTAKGKFTDAQLASTLQKLVVISELSEIKQADVVIEAIIEDLAIKKQLFKQLETIVTTETILATNTSSLSVTAIAADCNYPERVAGFHFFNPVPLMKIVEVIPGISTHPATTQVLNDLAIRMGHLGVVAKDTPGFIVNHAGRAYGTESLKIVGEGVASFEEIDRILRDGAGFRMGPFELMDLTGIDVSHPVMESIYHQYYQEPRYRPHPLTHQMLTGKKLGRKVGEGFYHYTENKKQDGQKLPVDSAQDQSSKALISDAVITSVWIGADLVEDRNQLVDYLNMQGMAIDTNEQPAADSLVLLATYGEDTTNAAIRYQIDPKQAVAIDMLTDLSKHRTLMPSMVTQAKFVAQAYALFTKASEHQATENHATENQAAQQTGIMATLIGESTGFVAQRVVAMVINLGCDIAMQGIATLEDIDNAVKLGLGYPSGPISWGDKLGAQRILLILTRIYKLTGDPRYRPSPWLQRRATLGISLLTQQTNCSL